MCQKGNRKLALAPQLVGRIPIHGPSYNNQNRRMIGWRKHGSIQVGPPAVDGGCFFLSLGRS